MTDISATPRSSIASSGSALMKKRNRHQTMLQGLGIAAISFAALMLFILIASLVSSGYKAFTQTHIQLEVFIDPEQISADKLQRGNFDDVLLDSLKEYFPDVEGRADLRKLESILSNGAQFTLRDRLQADPSLIGETVTVNVPISDDYDQLAKGMVDRDSPTNQRKLSDRQIGWFDTLQQAGVITQPINWALLTNADSRFPELAGLKGALVGSFWALLVCFLISFPLGIGAAIYLEEFAPKNKWSDIIEVNINNLAAVPSIVFGLLALAVFLGWFGMPRSAPLVGGMTLALMTMPTIIIATRAGIEGGAALDPRGGPRGGRVQTSGGVWPCPAACDARHPDRHDHRPRTGAWRDCAAAADRHERFHHLGPRLAA